jgi:hypothetical protein
MPDMSGSEWTIVMSALTLLVLVIFILFVGGKRK